MFSTIPRLESDCMVYLVPIWLVLCSKNPSLDRYYCFLFSVIIHSYFPLGFQFAEMTACGVQMPSILYLLHIFVPDINVKSKSSPALFQANSTSFEMKRLSNWADRYSVDCWEGVTWLRASYISYTAAGPKHRPPVGEWKK